MGPRTDTESDIWGIGVQPSLRHARPQYFPSAELEVHRCPHGLAPRGRKGRWNTVPSLVCALMTEVNSGDPPVSGNAR